MMLCDVVGRLFQGVCKKGLCIMDFFAGASCINIIMYWNKKHQVVFSYVYVAGYGT